MHLSPDAQHRYETRRSFFGGIDLNWEDREITFHSLSGCPTSRMLRHRLTPHNDTD